MNAWPSSFRSSSSHSLIETMCQRPTNGDFGFGFDFAFAIVTLSRPSNTMHKLSLVVLTLWGQVGACYTSPSGSLGHQAACHDIVYPARQAIQLLAIHFGRRSGRGFRSGYGQLDQLPDREP